LIEACSTSPLLPILLFVLIAAVDAWRSTRDLSLPLDGMTDEVAHGATAALGLLALFSGSTLVRHATAVIAALLASVLIDLDHLLLYAGVPHVAAEGRPYSHSAATVGLLLVLSWAWRRHRVLLSAAAVGVALHLLRDVSTGPGLPVWSSHGWTDVRLPYSWYVAALAGFVVVAVGRRLRRQLSCWARSV
jgi:inner membrane protein